MPAILCKSMYSIINYSTSICPFEFGKCGKEEEQLQRFEKFRDRKELFR